MDTPKKIDFTPDPNAARRRVEAASPFQHDVITGEVVDFRERQVEALFGSSREVEDTGESWHWAPPDENADPLKKMKRKKVRFASVSKEGAKESGNVVSLAMNADAVRRAHNKGVEADAAVQEVDDAESLRARLIACVEAAPMDEIRVLGKVGEEGENVVHMIRPKKD